MVIRTQYKLTVSIIIVISDNSRLDLVTVRQLRIGFTSESKFCRHDGGEVSSRKERQVIFMLERHAYMQCRLNAVVRMLYVVTCCQLLILLFSQVHACEKEVQNNCVK